jgi:tetratricopeptide (TPR) repeat protein
MLQDSNDLSGAEQAFRNAIRVQPDLIAAQYNLGALLARIGRKEEALKYLQLVAGSGDSTLRGMALDAIRKLR